MDKAGNFFITLEQNAKASGAKYDSDSPVFNKLRKQAWKKYPELKIFEEDYNKDYIYQKRRDIPILQIKQDKNLDSNLKLESNFPPPCLAVTVITLPSLVKRVPRLASAIPF